MCIQMPKRAERATRKFNSSPVLGEVPQAEGYECYNAAALQMDIVFMNVLILTLNILKDITILHSGISLARCAFYVFMA